MQKILVAFDFDHTLVDGNSDVHVQKLSCDGSMPSDLKKLSREIGWNEYMNEIFKFLHSHCKIEEKDYIRQLVSLPMINEIDTLLKFIESHDHEAIIISDSNSLFIKWILENNHLEHIFSQVYTNPAHFDSDGCLKIEYFHHQTDCTFSTANLCKRRVLEEHILKSKAEGIQYSNVVYVGDGSNDLCPAFSLTNKDYILARKDFQLHKQISKMKDNLETNVVIWTCGSQILDLLTSLTP